MLNGIARKRIEFPGNIVFDDTGSTTLVLTVADTRINPRDVSFRVSNASAIKLAGTTIKGRAVELQLQHDKANRLPAAFTAIPVLNNEKELNAVRTRVSFPGVLQVVPNVVYVSEKSDKLRVFIRGDAASISGQQIKGDLLITDSENKQIGVYQTSISVKPAGRSAVASILCEDLASLPTGRFAVEFSNDEVQFCFRVQVRCFAIVLASSFAYGAAGDCVVVEDPDADACEAPSYVDACQAACFMQQCRFGQTDYHLGGADYHIDPKPTHPQFRAAGGGEDGVELDGNQTEYQCIIAGDCICIFVVGQGIMCRQDKNTEPKMKLDNVSATACVGM